MEGCFMKEKNEYTKTEQANIELNNKIGGEEDDHRIDVAPFVNNNHTSLVVSDLKYEKKDKEKRDQ